MKRYYFYITVAIAYLFYDVFFLIPAKAGLAKLQLEDSVVDYAIGAGASGSAFSFWFSLFAICVIFYSALRILIKKLPKSVFETHEDSN